MEDEQETHNKDNKNKKSSASKCNFVNHIFLPVSSLTLSLSLATAKDLSHVPCKFYRVGSCTAGSSCPFSHSSPSTSANGQAQKDICAWFVKGNCKFGHKCALAHVLPGQSMAMDRKNKKAAQVAAAGAKNAASTNGGGKTGKRDQNLAGRGPLLSGSTAPTRALPNRMHMPSLKATISPSAPAPPVKDTDFASFGMDMGEGDDDGKLATAPALPQPTDQEKGEEKEKDASDLEASKVQARRSPTLPVSTPSAPWRTHAEVDFGPIGSPPRSSPLPPSHAHHHLSLHSSANFSPSGDSHAYLPPTGTSPFSAPGSQTIFIPNSPPVNTGRSGVAASLGAWGGLSSQANLSTSAVVEDEDQDLEEFIPGSLSDLLTPSERSRRMSRTNHTNQRPVLSGHNPSGNDVGNSGRGHHYSRSVPAPSLLSDIKSIWSSPNPTASNSNAPSPSQLPTLSHTHHHGIGTPSSFKSSFGGREDMNLSPSNASAAFLPGLHGHYLNRGASRGVQRSVSGSGGGLSTVSTFSGQLNGLGMTNGSESTMNTAFSPPRMNAFGSRPPFEHTTNNIVNNGSTNPTLSSTLHHSHLSSLLPSPSNPNTSYYPSQPPSHTSQQQQQQAALSPSTRALQSHAPGQSLPQGLAAGYSRIHALPPTNLPSPGYSSPGDWTPGKDGAGTSTSPALENMFSRLSFSAATSSSPSNNTTIPNVNTRPSQPSNLSMTMTPSPSLSRNASGGKPWVSGGSAGRSGGEGAVPGGPLSPLSGPVVTGDDDDLFSMDG